MAAARKTPAKKAVKAVKAAKAAPVDEVDPLFADQIPPHAPGTTTSTPAAVADADGHLPTFHLA